MSPPLTSADWDWLGREAEVLAMRMVRQFRLPHHERDDLRQELLMDLVTRLEAFDSTRGTLAALAGTVMAHRTRRLVARLRRQRTLFAPISLDEPTLARDGSTIGDNITESDGYLALHGQLADRIAEIERRLDLERALSLLEISDLQLCAHLICRSPNELSREGVAARASLYRRLRELRLQLLAAGIAAAA
jgi:hypothetical protein